MNFRASCFFLLSAMTIVELIDAHDGFNIITDRINQTNLRKLVWIVAIITFFLSALLDNLRQRL
jgi:Na+/H+ antiporter NhaD/arsenite permease-like protein